MLPVGGKVRLLLEHLFPPVVYVRRQYRVHSPIGTAFAYLRRIVLGVPKWFAGRSPM
jgi:hypothetical protein